MQSIKLLEKDMGENLLDLELISKFLFYIVLEVPDITIKQEK